MKAIVAELPESVPLIGFSGAPYTNACYMIEGQGSKSWVEVKRLMYTQPEAMDQLKSILRSREALYEQADVTFDTSGKSRQEALDALLALIDARGFLAGR